jgi:hypothetical protein
MLKGRKAIFSLHFTGNPGVLLHFDALMFSFGLGLLQELI